MSGITNEQVYMICHGSGANGKGCFLSALRYVMGEYAYNAPFSTFELSNRPSIPNDLAALEKRRFVISSETNESTRLNEARLKALSGEDPATARRLYHEHFTFIPECKIWLAVNHKPRVRDDSYGFWRRVRLIPFQRQFKGADADKNLANKLQAEAPGILNWLIAGNLEWQKRGLEPVPKAVIIATEEYQAESDPLSQFIDERCVIGERHTARALEIYKAYRSWVKDLGLPDREHLTNTAFGRRMSLRYEKGHDRQGTFYRGIKVNEDENGDNIVGISPSTFVTE